MLESAEPVLAGDALADDYSVGRLAVAEGVVQPLKRVRGSQRKNEDLVLTSKGAHLLHSLARQRAKVAESGIECCNHSVSLEKKTKKHLMEVSHRRKDRYSHARQRSPRLFVAAPWHRPLVKPLQAAEQELSI